MDYNIREDDLFIFAANEIEEKGLVHHHISSANDLYEIGIPQIITQVFEINTRVDDIRRDTDEEKEIEYIIIKVNFSNVDIGKPTSLLNYNSGREEVIFPNMARLKEKNYSAVIRVDISVNVTAYLKNGGTTEKSAFLQKIKLGNMPIMVGSKWCNTYGMSSETLTKLNEDPEDPGGYFIIKGNEWVVDCIENILFNKVRIFKNEGYKKEMMRAEFISKPGDFYLNSDQFIIRWLTDGQLTIEIKSDKLKEVYIPFYLLFRIMGWNTDKQIFDNILFDYNSPTSKKISQYLNKGFNAKYSSLPDARFIYDQGSALQYMAEELAPISFDYLEVNRNPENYKKIISFILDYVDIHFMQHMGTDMKSRDKKLRLLCIIIRKVFLVNLKNMEPTDRDSYNSKRIAAAGVSCAKTFKTYFNSTIIQQIKRRLVKDFKTLSFSRLDLGASVRSSIHGSDFERALIQSITSGNKSEITVSNRKRINRLSSQLLHRKNQLNTYAVLRQVTTPSSDSAKQSDRANEMRRVHMSFYGYICPTHSPEGEKVGLNKQLALCAYITKASSSEVIKDILLDDPEVYDLDKIDYSDISNGNLCNIYVNGYWLGCCKDALLLAKKYRHIRRNGKITPDISIVWDNTQDEVYFWTDAGRVIRALLIVYNNKRDSEDYKRIVGKVKKIEPFTQGLGMTQDIIDGLYSNKYKMDDLLKMKIVEYISAEEQENMFLAASFEILKENKNNELLEYTHCDIPKSVFGITAVTSPFAAHNQAQRIVYQTSQSKQTGGIPTKNWPHRSDKDIFIQWHNEIPLVRTISNNLLNPNGSNAIVAIMCYTGYNQEDSMIMNQGAEHRGAFRGCKKSFYKTELEHKEEFGNPNSINTVEIKTAHYNNLNNGIIKKSIQLNKDDAIIGKLLKISKGAGTESQYVDKSIIYKDDEPSFVHNVIVDRNEDGEQFCKVVTTKVRNTTIGDKFSVIGTSQVMTDSGWKEIKTININKDKIATMDKNGRLCYVYASGLSNYYYNGNMYTTKSDLLDINVTKNHKLYVKLPEDETYNLYRTWEVMNKGAIYKTTTSNTNTLYMNNILFTHIMNTITNFGNFSKEVWLLNEESSQLLYTKIITNSDIISDYANLSMEDDYIEFNRFYNNITFINNFCKLVFHCGWSSIINKDNHVKVYKNPETILNNHKVFYEEYKEYKGYVYCLEIPFPYQHIYYSRENNNCMPVWTGNSARSGQKSTIGILLNDADMPRTREGLVPTMIMNPHAIPSRMTIGQLIESQVGTLCAEKGTQTDATIFKKVDIDSISSELEELGFDSHGYQRLYSGITGEYIDCKIFIGPTYYQRLHKFTMDTQYAVSSAPSDCITYQPLNGKSSGGGLKIGEMERDVIVSHSAMKFMTEKFFNHSDGYTNYVCRCGKMAVVNLEEKIYKCNYCKDNADIVAYDTSWSSKLFMQELESINVGIRQKPDPFTYIIDDEKVLEML